MLRRGSDGCIEFRGAEPVKPFETGDYGFFSASSSGRTSAGEGLKRGSRHPLHRMTKVFAVSGQPYVSVPPHLQIVPRSAVPVRGIAAASAKFGLASRLFQRTAQPEGAQPENVNSSQAVLPPRVDVSTGFAIGETHHEPRREIGGNATTRWSTA